MTFIHASAALLFAAVAASASAQSPSNYLAGDTVLIIRHAEKPPTGSGLTPQGDARARAYVHYFEPFHEQDIVRNVDALYSGADSENSLGPRLTLEPLSKASGLPLHATVSTKHPEELVAMLKSEPHGHTPLIAWRHGQIPALLQALGASPEKLLPNGVWPDEVFDNVIVLTYDQAGLLIGQKLVHETLRISPTDLSHAESTVQQKDPEHTTQR